MTQAKYPAIHKRGYQRIEKIAKGVRKTLGFDLTGRLPGLKIFNSLGQYRVSLDSGQSIKMTYDVQDLEPGIEAEARYELHCGELVVVLTEETYVDLENDVPRARFSLFHEIGHAVMHPNELVKLSRIPRNLAALHRGGFTHLRPFENVEWQANAFAAALSMPALGLERLLKVDRLEAGFVQEEFQASATSAAIRIDNFQQRRKELLDAYK